MSQYNIVLIEVGDITDDPDDIISINNSLNVIGLSEYFIQYHRDNKGLKIVLKMLPSIQYAYETKYPHISFHN